jgi:hypothetical protein
MEPTRLTERPRGTLRLSPKPAQEARSRPPTPQKTAADLRKPREETPAPKPPRKKVAFAPNPSNSSTKAGLEVVLGISDAPRFFNVFVEPGQEPRQVSIRPSAIKYLVAGKDRFKNKTWLYTKYSETSGIPLDTHFAIISSWWNSCFPGSVKTPQEMEQLEWECYAALKLKYEGVLPEPRKR